MACCQHEITNLLITIDMYYTQNKCTYDAESFKEQSMLLLAPCPTFKDLLTFPGSQNTHSRTSRSPVWTPEILTRIRETLPRVCIASTSLCIFLHFCFIGIASYDYNRIVNQISRCKKYRQTQNWRGKRGVFSTIWQYGRMSQTSSTKKIPCTFLSYFHVACHNYSTENKWFSWLRQKKVCIWGSINFFCDIEKSVFSTEFKPLRTDFRLA